MGEAINTHYSLVRKETLRDGPLVGDIGLKRSRTGISCGLCAHGDEMSGSVKDEEFLCQLFNCPEIREYGRGGSVALTTRHPLYAKVEINIADKRRPHGRYSSLAE
jgi:hypothetical protein